MKTYRTYSSAETRTLGAVIAEQILRDRKRNQERKKAAGARVVALVGDLGAGKTTFTQGFLRALGVRSRVTSPTFVIMKRFPLGAQARKAGFTNAYHVDAYRFREASEAGTLGLKKTLQDPSALVLVEWPERLVKVLPRRKTTVRFRHGGSEGERVIIGP